MIKIRDVQGNYFTVTADTILDAAREAIDSRYQRGIKLSSPDDSRDLFKMKLVGSSREVFAVAYLDTRHHLIAYEELFYGSIDGAEVHPRIIVKQALIHNAAAVILSHNHPSGNPEPSAADRAVTHRIKQSLALVDVRLLDHIIVGGNETLSMAAKGLV